VPISKVEEYLTKYKNCYERTNPTEADPSATLNRVYIDLDGTSGDIGKREFDELVENITMSIKLGIDEPVCIMESSKHQLDTVSPASGFMTTKNKLSFRIQFLKRHGTKAAVAAFVKEYIPKLNEILCEHITITDDCRITPRLEVDMGVYNPKGRKMRMLGSSKNFKLFNEDRPNKIVSDGHDVLDTLITYIPGDSEQLPEPEEEVVEVKKPAPKKRGKKV
jgi:hypothetical protein